VADAAVVGVPDAAKGEVVLGFVVPRDRAELTEADLINGCRDALASYKVPARIFIAAELPRTSTGKLSRRTLRELAMRIIESSH
jgi:long-chain acyl-CoA synthetase